MSRYMLTTEDERVRVYVGPTQPHFHCFALTTARNSFLEDQVAWIRISQNELIDELGSTGTATKVNL